MMIYLYIPVFQKRVLHLYYSVNVVITVSRNLAGHRKTMAFHLKAVPSFTSHEKCSGTKAELRVRQEWRESEGQKESTGRSNINLWPPCDKAIH